MKTLRVFLGLFLIALVPLVTAGICLADPSSDLYKHDDETYDDWDVCRTRPFDDDGFLQLVVTDTSVWLGDPLIILESLGEWSNVAYSMGEGFIDEYPDPYQRAEAIFNYVRDSVQYTSDSSQFGMTEFAQNADELALEMESNGYAYGDCEDYAILLAVMYRGAGYRSAIALMSDGESGHSATFVHLPDYDKAVSWTINDVDGWVWAEATGDNNPFGWFSEDYFLGCVNNDGFILVKEVSLEHIERVRPHTLSWSLSSFSFNAIQGEENPPSQTLDISNVGFGTVEWSASDDAEWLTMAPSRGTLTGETDIISLSVDITDMEAGLYSATATISAPETPNSPQMLSVLLDIAPAPFNPVPWIIIFFVSVGVMAIIIGISVALSRRRRARIVRRRKV